VGLRVNVLLGAALAISAVGDLFLGVRRMGALSGESLFMLGLGAFLVAHLVYIFLFRGYGAFKRGPAGAFRKVAIGAIVLAVVSLLLLLWNSLGPLRIPVVVYALVLAGMAIAANLAELDRPWAAIGALLFVGSDAMIAISKFRAPFAGSETLIWTTYYLAQLLILWGVSSNHARHFVSR
jgi:uncharacterized membrane protein YhhN